MKASDIARIVGGRLEGRGDPEISGVASLDRASSHELTFLAHPRYQAYLQQSRAGAILIQPDLYGQESIDRDRAYIVVDDVRLALATAIEQLYPEPKPTPGVHPTAVIGAGVKLGDGVSIGPYAVIGEGTRLGDRARIGAHVVIGDGCEIGDDVVLHPHVTLYAGVRIGARSIVHSGARLGVDGFGYVYVDGEHRKVPQVGGCEIGEAVEIGANTTIDRGSIGATKVGDGAKIDNMVHLGHNVELGAKSIVIAQVGVAGSTKVGRGVTLGGQVGVAGHVTIGDGATVAAQAGVFGDLAGGETYSGYPARPHKEALRSQAAVARLPRWMKRIRALETALQGREKGSE